MVFKLAAEFAPAGDQPAAIASMLEGWRLGERHQTLLGVTGSGKTFTLANVIAEIGLPVLVLSHNKTLAAQLYSEFKAFFPENAVEYFISYYDYYLPESYIPQTDTYIAKDASINENIERLRLSATASLLSRRDVILVASVSCIYGLGSPEDYERMCVAVGVGQALRRDELLRHLVEIQYGRNDAAPERGQFRVRGDAVDVFPPDREEFVRVGFWGDEIESLERRDHITGNRIESLRRHVFFPCRHFVMPADRVEAAVAGIARELDERVRQFEEAGKLVEAQRLHQRTTYDIEMIREIGYCAGIENYSFHLSPRPSGGRPFCLLDFFPKEFLAVIDESHVSIPQVGAMFKADRSRKQTLVDHGFRLPSALENRPLRFEEFLEMTSRGTIFMSATPGDFELKLSSRVVEQVVRPTGLLDPEIIIRPLEGQVDDVIGEIRDRAVKGERVIVTTLTKKSSERLADYLTELDLRVKYLHSEIDAIQRSRLLRELRAGEFDCIIGVNLLREGIDLPEVSLVAILDADKEGFLRSKRALIQVAGRAARNVNGQVILYADKTTDAIAELQRITLERRARQDEHNKLHGITPTTIVKGERQTIYDSLADYGSSAATAAESAAAYDLDAETDFEKVLAELETEMFAAADKLEFERAAAIRDQINKITPKKAKK